VLLTKCYSGDKIEMSDTGRARGLCGGKGNAYSDWVGKAAGKNHWEDLGVGGEYLNSSLVVWEGVEFINLREDRSMWRAVVNTVMNIRDSQNAGNTFASRTSTAFSRMALRHCDDDCYYVRVVIRRPQDALL
jgi:hypothetical protein